MAKLDENGHEVLDSTPLEIPLNFKKPEPLAETIRRLIRREISNQAVSQGMESFEEADDFEVGDDYDPSSPYEVDEAKNSVFEEEFVKPRREKKNKKLAPKAPSPEKNDSVQLEVLEK